MRVYEDKQKSIFKASLDQNCALFKTHIGAVLCIFKIRQEKSHRVETIPIDRSIEDKILWIIVGRIGFWLGMR